MKKYTIFYALFFAVSNQAFAQLSCASLMEGKPALVSKANFSEAYRDIINKTNAVRDNAVFTSIFSENQRPDWNAYNNISILLKTIESDSFRPLSNIEKLSLKNEFKKKNATLEQSLSDALKNPDFLEAYKKHIDAHYALFELMKKVNDILDVPVFPKARFDLTISNAETKRQGEKILSDLNESFAKDFAEHSGHKSLEEYKEFVRNHDETSKKIVDLMEDHVLVAMHRPENARFWIPLTGFQNQRVTGSSKGALTPDGRNQAESNLLLLDQNEYVKNSVRFMPKYAEVIVGRDIADIQNGKWADGYGSDLWIIKKSVLEKRATWTPTDSLSPGIRYRASSKVDGFIPWSFRSLATPFLYNSIKANKLFQPAGIFEPLKFNNSNWSFGDYYTEVQIYGDVNINDVAALHFRGNPPDAEMMTYLKSKNIEVFDDRTGKPVKYIGGL